jgi:hypothetical protein
MIRDRGFPQKGPTKIYCDSQAYIAITKNPKFHTRTKYIKRRYHFICDTVKAKEIEFIYLETSQNPANMFTKSLPRFKFEFCKERVRVYSITPLKHELIESSTKKACI